ncbi:MAG: NAD-dependent epimerase/dehydratase family protein [Flavobacteriales bacterium]|nr:NAD-dependent epimerase/dehydratase family protein [Flavobacteriales bacterium]
MSEKILVIGAAGQIGTELVLKLRESKGAENVIAADLKKPNEEVLAGGKFVQLDILDEPAARTVISDNSITEVYLLAALLSATAEKNPMFAWKLNMDGLFNILNIAKEGIIKKVFWPSSIAVFGPSSPKKNTPQTTIMEPITVYGISKQAGERWCEYYFRQYGVDVRSIRYPGLISYKSLPGGGTTDYAVDIYYKALENASFTCFLDENMKLPMMYMEDAIRATIELMDAPIENIKIRSSYNISGMSFSPKEIAQSIQNHISGFKINYSIDYRNKIAETWPDSISDSSAREDWDWEARYGLKEMTKNMLKNLSQ